MSLQPHFYLGPIEVSLDENEALAVVWHTQALKRTTELSSHLATGGGLQVDVPEALVSDRSQLMPQGFFMPTFFIDKLSDPSPATVDSVYGVPPADSQVLFMHVFQPSIRVVSVAECLNLNFYRSGE